MTEIMTREEMLYQCLKGEIGQVVMEQMLFRHITVETLAKHLDCEVTYLVDLINCRVGCEVAFLSMLFSALGLRVQVLGHPIETQIIVTRDLQGTNE